MSVDRKGKRHRKIVDRKESEIERDEYIKQKREAKSKEMSVLNEVNNLSASHVPAAVSYDDDARTTTHPTHVGDPLTKSTTTRNRSCSGWVIWPLPLLPFTTTKEGFIWVKAAKVALR